MAKQAGPVDEPSLRALKARGETDPLIDLRLEYAEKAQLLNHYIGPAAGRPTKSKKEPWLRPSMICECGHDRHQHNCTAAACPCTGYRPTHRAFPDMMPTQASGRWSITRPPLPTFPPEYRGIVVPDPGWCFAVWDFDAIEARIVACLSHDTQDLDAFAKGWDLHTLTACDTFNMVKPKNFPDPHTSAEDANWRSVYKWGGKDDRRRHMAKGARYALYYALDHRGILNIKDAEKLAEMWGQDPATFRMTLLKIGYDYLKSKPRLTATKKRAWESAWRTHKATTAFGRVRPLMGDRKDVMKEGWNHEVQGTATDIMNQALIAIDARWPESVLAYQSHDSGTIAFPLDVEWWPEIRGLVEREYVIAGHTMKFTGTWTVVPPLGRPQKYPPEEWFGGMRDADRA